MVEDQFRIQILPMWRGKPTSTEVQYTQGVRAELSRILLSRAGRALAAALRFQFSSAGPSKVMHGNAITVMPFEEDPDDAAKAANDPAAKDCKTKDGRPAKGDGNAQEDGSTPGSPVSVVLFDPTTLRTACFHGKAATLPHEILFHELVHSLRRVSGHLHPHAVINQLMPFTHTEEFLAILVTNIFISDGTNHSKTSLRADHQSHRQIDPELADSYRFFSLGLRAFNIISTFCDENAGFSRMLAEVPAKFNPIAAYYKNRKKAFEMAANGDAERVFQGMTPYDYFKDPGGVWRRFAPYQGPPVKSGRR